VPSDAYAAVDTWTDHTSASIGSNPVYDVSMIDASNGVAVGTGGTIVYTADWKKTLKVLESTNQLEYIPLEEQMKSLSVKQKDLLLVQLVKQLS